MTQQEVIEMFRQQSNDPSRELPSASDVIRELAQLLADSRGRLSKENFEALMRIGAVLYKEGRNQFDARADVADIMNKSNDGERSA